MKTKRCGKCKYCYQMYDRTGYTYSKCYDFYCALKDDITNVDGCCERWKQNKVEYDLSVERLRQTEKDLIFMIENVDVLKKDF